MATNLKLKIISPEEMSTNLIIRIAKLINEKPEDVAWFFEIKQLMDKLGTGEFEQKSNNRNIEIKESTETLLKEAKKAYKKYKRIENKLKKIGLV